MGPSCGGAQECIELRVITVICGEPHISPGIASRPTRTPPPGMQREQRLVSPCGCVFKEWWDGQKGRNSEGGKYWAVCPEGQKGRF